MATSNPFDKTDPTTNKPTPLPLPRLNLAQSRSQPLPTRIATLQTTIAHIQSELSSSLDKIAVLQQPRSPITPDTTVNPTSSTSRSDIPHYLTHQQKRTLLQSRVTLDAYVEGLQRYNEMKDAATGMIALVAEREGRVTGDVVRERGWMVEGGEVE